MGPKELDTTEQLLLSLSLFPQFINLVPSFLNHQSCLPAVQDHPLGEK